MKTLKKFALPLILVSVVAFSAIGTTWALYASSGDVTNRITTLKSGVTLKEIFNPADQWVPGETKQKEVYFGNSGEAKQIIRFKVTEKWYDNNGTPDRLYDDNEWTYTGTYNPPPATIHFTQSLETDWVKIDDYYYYTKILDVGADTPRVIDNVQFSNEINNGGYNEEEDFSNKRYALTVHLEALNVNTSESLAAWGMTFTENNSKLNWTKVN